MKVNSTQSPKLPTVSSLESAVSQMIALHAARISALPANLLVFSNVRWHKTVNQTCTGNEMICISPYYHCDLRGR